MYVYEGKYTMVQIPDDVYGWKANREEIKDKLREINEMIESMLTGETQPWPGMSETEGPTPWGLFML